MKNVNLLFSLCLFFISSTQFCDAQTIKGSGNTVTETVNMKDISGIGLGISAKVFIQPGNSQKIEIKGQKNIIDLIKKKPTGKTWNIEFPNNSNVRNYERLEIYVTLKKLESLSIGGSGSITGKGKFKNVQDLGISIGGSGDIDIEVEADEIECSIGGSGKINLAGNADELEISIGGSGDVKAINLIVKECEVSSAGSGNVDIHVNKTLTVSLVGSGDVRYKGNPKIKSSIIGSGDIKPY